MLDRFGPLPQATKDLLDALRLRWLAQHLGFEKLILKFGKMTGVFTGSEEDGFFQSELFGKILEAIKARPDCCEMKEKKGKLTLVFGKTENVKKALENLKMLQQAFSE